MNAAAEFLSGICMATFAASGLYFLKFWRASSDRFFLFFSFACFILALERVILLLVREFAASTDPSIAESNSWVYIMRLFAFTMMMIAILDKNRRSLKR